MIDLPQPVAEIVNELAGMRGTVAVALGGSRAQGPSDEDADWDLGLYYRQSIDLARLAARDVVYPPGSWGRLMNGGAWLRHAGQRIDVLLRDLDVVDYWTDRAERGEFEVDALLGYAAGVPTYLLTAELASCRVLHGELPAAPFPAALVSSAPPRWRFSRSFSLDYARVHARRGNRVGALGQAAKAVMEEAHARLCERGRWVCNEKRLIDSAGLDDVHVLFGHAPADNAGLVQWIDCVAMRLGAGAQHDAMPWSRDHMAACQDGGSTDEIALAQLQQVLADAWMRGDRPTIERIIAPEWTSIGPDGQRSDRATVFAAVFDTGEHRIHRVEIDDVRVLVFGDAAVVTGRTHGIGEYGASPYDVVIRFTDTFVRRNGQWTAVASHASLESAA